MDIKKYTNLYGNAAWGTPREFVGTTFVGNSKAKRNILLKPLKAKKQGVGNARCVPPKEFNEKM